MSITVIIPDVNPVRFAEENKVISGQIGHPSFGQGLTRFMLRGDQLEEAWEQPVTRKQVICFQFKRGRIGTYAWNYTVLDFYDEDDNFLKSIPPTSQLNSTDIDSVTGEPLDTCQYMFKIEDYAELNGKDKLVMRLKCVFGDAALVQNRTQLWYISETFDVADEHPDTELITASNSVNAKGILFQQLRPIFMLRVPTRKRMIYSSGGEYELFTDHRKNIVTLSGNSTNQYKLDIGGPRGVPDYYEDILDELLDLDNLRVGDRLVRRTTKELEKEGTPGVQLKRLWAKLQDLGSIFSFTQSNVLGWTRPATGFPYAIDQAQITDGFIYTGAGPKAFFNSTDEDNLISALNTALISLGVSGRWSKVTDGGIVKFYFVNAEGERFTMNGQPEVFPTRLKLNVSVATAGDNFRYILAYLSSLITYKHVVCYADATGAEELWQNPTASPYTIVDHAFSTTGNKVVNIFTNDKEYSFRCVHGSVSPAIIYNWSGSFPKSCNEIYLLAHDFSALASLSLTPLQRSQGSLQYITLESCGIKGFTANWAAGIVSGSFKGFPKITFFDAPNNLMTTGSVDSFINEFHDSTNFKTSAFKAMRLNVQGNTPTASPSGTSLSARNDLDAKGWYVLTD